MRIAAFILVAVTTLSLGSDLVEFLTGAEIQCEDSGRMASCLLFLLTADEAQIRAHLFPDYSGSPAWTLSEFLYHHFVPAEGTTTFGTDPAAQVVTPEARRILRRFYMERADEITSVPIR